MMKPLMKRLTKPTLNLFFILIAAFSAEARSSFEPNSGFVPPECTTESWCVMTVTECFVGFVDHSNGFNQALAHFSAVRKATALCPVSYSSFPERRVIQGPVESGAYRSEIFTNEDEAKANALSICNRYRTDWVAAAPVCRN